MIIAFVLSLSAAPAQTSPRRLDDPSTDAQFAETRSVIACADRFLASSDSDALIGSYLEKTRWAKLFANDSAQLGQSDATAKQAARAQVRACFAGVSREEKIQEGLEQYIGLSLAERGLFRRLGAASVDLGKLAAFDLNDLITGRIPRGEVKTVFKKMGITKANEDEAAAYIFLHKTNSMLGLLSHPPARAAHLLSGAIFDTDYPEKSKAANKQGKSHLIFEVSATGTVSGCEVFISSGTELLDQTACRLITDRYRYEPARDDQGHPINQKVFQTVHWRLVEMPRAAPPYKP